MNSFSTVDTTEAAQRLHITSGTVLKWIKVGKLDAVKCGQQWRVREISIYLAQEHERDGACLRSTCAWGCTAA